MPADLLERARELGLLDEWLASVRASGRGLVALVGGEAGVGKSALVRRFCDEHQPSTPVLWGDCDPLFAPRPLGPLLAVAETTQGELAQVLTSGAMPHDVVAAVAAELRGRAPAIFVLEDVHWADEATLDVLRLLGRRLQTVPALIIATYRDDALERSHPLRLVLGELGTTSTVRRLKLAPLSQAAVAHLAEAHHLDADELYHKTAGNPFFVVEALSAGGESIPDSVRDAVLARAARLGEGALALLEAVAVVPPYAELWLLQALAPDSLGHLEACLSSGMLTAAAHGVAFRHELARLAVEESIVVTRLQELHTRALEALANPPGGTLDLARPAHHAEAARNAEAVLRYAPAAAALASSLGAYREAAAQYARALRFGERLSPAQRATLLEGRGRACYLADESSECIAALEAALACRRVAGDGLAEGDTLRQLSDVLWCPGRTTEAMSFARQAIELLETLPAGRELAAAYANLSQLCSAATRTEEAVLWGNRALSLAEQLGETAIAVYALGTVGINEAGPNGQDKIRRSLALARQIGLDEHVARAYLLLAGPAVDRRRYAEAASFLNDGIAFCSERGQELYLQYLVAHRARLELDQGRWTDAANSAAAVLRTRRTSITPRILALVVLGLVRTRRGDPEHWEPLEEAWQLAEPTGELARLGPVAAARAEAAWLDGDASAVEAASAVALRLSIERDWRWLTGELAVWRRRAGLIDDMPLHASPAFARELAGHAEEAAAKWAELGCPYESALALAEAQEPEAQRRALEELRRLGAEPAVAMIGRRLRERGARGVPRGPRQMTRNNPAGLTRRELEVLRLVAEGLRDAEIADQLVLSDRTVGHHVSSILGKLSVRSRAEAGAHAIRLGLTGDVFDQVK